MNFVDALYGSIEVNLPLTLIKAPELQRLREIRLCNINSPFITGGTSINRFEHAIGTAYLAQIVAKNHIKKERDKEAFIFASILHDIVTAPFGHSLEYLYETIHSTEYEHSNIWHMFFSGKTIPSSRFFYAASKVTLQYILNQDILEVIQNILEGKHTLSKFLVHSIDIDNIDNVFRFAYHIGLDFDKKVPAEIASNIDYEDNLLTFPASSIFCLEEWFRVRKILYRHLLENEGEFVAKALLERAFIECIKEEHITEDDWVMTDAEVVSYILNKGNSIARSNMKRLMLMDFPEFRSIFIINDYKALDLILSSGKLNIVNFAYENGCYLHFIRDVRKTCRQLQVKTKPSNEVKQIGYLNDRYLVGLFSDSQRDLVKIEEYLKGALKINLIPIMDLYRNDKQHTLF